MGSEDLHSKRSAGSKKQQRKARKAQQQQRNTPKVKSADRILITCEGSKTEPFYIKALRDNLRINTANIKIIKSGSSPLTVVKKAIDFYKNNKEFDKIFCIIDRDQHTDYEEAINIAQQISLSKNDEKQVPALKVISSIPCFEYWLLLHFEDTDQPFHSTEKKSICDQVGEALKNHLGFYGKGKALITNLCANQQQIATQFNLTVGDINKNCCCNQKEKKCFNYFFNNILVPRQEAAKKRAKGILQRHIETNTTDKNPSTEMYEFVEYLENITNINYDALP